MEILSVYLNKESKNAKKTRSKGKKTDLTKSSR